MQNTDRQRRLCTFYRRSRGHSPTDSSPLTCVIGDRAYEVEVAIELSGSAEGGLLLFYDHKAFVGLGFNGQVLKTFQYSEEPSWFRQPAETPTLRIKLTNDHNVVTYHYSLDDGKSWVLHGHRMEVSGIHHNVFGGFLSLRVGLYSAGRDSVQFRDFRYRAI